jgi:hypothetical protein
VRWVQVAPERLEKWLAGFAERHGAATTEVEEAVVRLADEDGSTALVEVPFPPLVGDLVEHALRDRVVGVLLVRRGGHAVGVFDGPRLVASKVGGRHVQGRTAAGGWSQQRFARRRANQAAAAFGAAADTAAALLLDRPLDAVMVGGDRQAVDAVLQDPRLAPLRPLVTGRLLAVPDPRLKVLQELRFRDVWIGLEP